MADAQLDAPTGVGAPTIGFKKSVSHDSTQWGKLFQVKPRLPLPTGVPDFRELVTTALPALFGVWRSVGSETVTAPVVGVLRCPAIAFSPLRVAPDRLYRLP